MIGAMPTLFIRDYRNNIRFMKIGVIENMLFIWHGIWGTKSPVKYNKYFTTNQKAADEANRRWKDKQSQGYKVLPENLSALEMLDVLPKHKIDENQMLLPMKCQVFQKVKTKTFPMFAQPKVNGLRGVLRYESIIEGAGMFAVDINVWAIWSKENLRYLVPIPEKNLYILNKDFVYDGEVFIPGKKVNEINKSIPRVLKSGTVTKNTSPTPSTARFIIFDLAMPDIPQSDRFSMLGNFNSGSIPAFKLGEDALRESLAKVMTDSSPIQFLPTYIVRNEEEATWFTNLCIDCGYEGAVFRDPDAEYAFGHRAKTMLKYKLKQSGLFTILDIYKVNEIDGREYILFELRNDINPEIFKATPLGDAAARERYIEERDELIGKKALVKFYERTGVKDVPFHANVIKILDKDVKIIR